MGHRAQRIAARAGLAVLFGFGASGEVGRGGTLGLALKPVQVTQHALVAAFPAEILSGGEGGGEVAGQACGVGHAAAGCGGEAAALVGNLLVVAAGLGGSAGVAQGLGPVVEHHLLQVGGQQVGVEDGGEPADDASAVLVLAAGEGAEEFHEGAGGRAGRRGRVG
jgi:hypothetical protein